MTEDEAKTKWCPFARLSALTDKGETIGGAGNRAAVMDGNQEAQFNENPESCRCLASACMAWRWNAIVAPGVDAIAPVKLDVGFCGLAGAPR